MADPSAREYFLLEEQKLAQIDKFVTEFHKKENEVYQKERNKHARTPTFNVGDVVLLKNLSVEGLVCGGGPCIRAWCVLFYCSCNKYPEKYRGLCYA